MEQLLRLKLSKKLDNQQIVVLCIGSGKMFADSFGVFVGEFLKEKNLPFYIYGNSKNNVTSVNIIDFVNCIMKRHNNPFLIVIDSTIDDNIEDCSIKICDSICPAVTTFNSKCNFAIGSVGILYKTVKILNNKIVNLVSVNEMLNTSKIVANALSNAILKLKM